MEQKKNLIKRIKAFLTDVKGELKKVTWPTQSDVIKTTLAVVISSVIFGIYLAMVDILFKNAIEIFIEWVK